MTGKRKERTRYAHLTIKSGGLVEELEELCVLGLPMPQVHVGDLKFGSHCGWLRVVRSEFRHLEGTERRETERKRERERGWRRRRKGGMEDWGEGRGTNVNLARASVGVLANGKNAEHMQTPGMKHIVPPAIPGSERAADGGREALACGTYARDAHPWSVGGTRRILWPATRGADPDMNIAGDGARSLPASTKQKRGRCMGLDPGSLSSSPDPRPMSTLTACLLSEDHDSAT
ncbi:hypothetical protein B0H19DRAFT_1070932 [Mycena capillaripes]|nr:hypothetical protein B0H19DRAFT_1070932 [Mycena capillaripes]